MSYLIEVVLRNDCEKGGLDRGFTVDVKDMSILDEIEKYKCPYLLQGFILENKDKAVWKIGIQETEHEKSIDLSKRFEFYMGNMEFVSLINESFNGAGSGYLKFAEGSKDKMNSYGVLF